MVPNVPAPRLPSRPSRTTQYAVDRSRHPGWRCGQHLIAAVGGAGRRLAQRRGRADESIARSAAPGAAVPLPRGAVARVGGRAATLVRPWPVARTSLDPVAAAVRRPPGPAPDDRLGAVRRPSASAMSSDHAEASAGQRGEGLGIVGRSRHVSRIRRASEGCPVVERLAGLAMQVGEAELAQPIQGVLQRPHLHDPTVMQPQDPDLLDPLKSAAGRGLPEPFPQMGR